MSQFEVVYNKSLKIFSQLYVGVKPTPANGGTPLAFATPYEDTAAGRKRQDTVKGWVGDTEYIWDPVTGKGKNVKYEPDLRIVNNTPRFGFKVTDEVKRVYYGGGNVVWRIEDPSGWEVEIQSNNLMALLQSVGVSAGGLINGECIWARDGAQNVLIPVTSQEYIDATKAAESAKKPGKIPMKDRVIGRYYRLQDGMYGQYLGKFYITELLTEGELDTILGATFPGLGACGVQSEMYSEIVLNGQQEQYEVLYIPPHEIGDEYKYKVGGTLRLYKSAAVIAELDQGEITEEAALRIVAENKLEFAGTKKTTRPILATRHQPKDVELTFVPIPDAKFEEALKRVVCEAQTALQHYERDLKDEYWKNRTPPSQPTPPKFSPCSMFLWKRICLLDDDKRVFAYSSAINAQYSSRRLGEIMGFMEPRNGDSLVFVKPVERHARVWQIGFDSWNSADHIRGQALMLPRFDTIDELKTYLHKLHLEKKLVHQRCKENT